jgi:hypothetical protein
MMAALLYLVAAQVARRVNFSAPQLLQLQLAMRVYARMSRATANEGSDVLQNMASLSISRVLEGNSGDSSSGSSGNNSGSSSFKSSEEHAQQAELAAAAEASNAAAVQASDAAAPAAALPAAALPAAADARNDGAAQIAAINSQLQRHMLLRNIQAQATNIVMLNHMTKLQIARMFVGELHAPLLWRVQHQFAGTQLAHGWKALSNT